jgi:hypothetical protein
VESDSYEIFLSLLLLSGRFLGARNNTARTPAALLFLKAFLVFNALEWNPIA